MKKIEFIFLFFISFIFSCVNEGDDINDYSVNTEKSLYNELMEMGFDENSILEYEDFYIVEYDMIFYKNSKKIKKNTASKDSLPETAAHYHTGTLIGQNNQQNINVFIDPALGNWFGPTQNAINNWDNINNCNLNFSIVTNRNDADLEILADDDNTLGLSISGISVGGTLAIADFPSNNNIGNIIIVDNEINYCEGNINNEQYRTVIQHEIGHTIGLRHSYYLSGDENQNGTTPFGTNYSAIHISGTPTGNDTNSIMNAGCPITERNFSTFDIIAVQNMYPIPTPPPPRVYTLNNAVIKGSKTKNLSCSATSNIQYGTYYSNKNLWSLGVGDKIYTSSNLISTLNGNNLWFKIGLLSFKINSSGTIIERDDCGAPI